MKRSNWNHDELIAAFNLYCKIPFTKINSRNKQIIELAGILGRSVSAVALKLANFARFDPALKSRNIAGMRHGSKSEIEIWKEFQDNWENSSYESELLVAKFKRTPVERSANIDISDLPQKGEERRAVVKVRVNQSFFRSLILSSYDNKCCITGLDMPELLVASHIVPWSIDSKNRMNPHNGLCLNVFHDKAFDAGFLTITPEYKVKLSGYILKKKSNAVLEKYFLPFDNCLIRLPQRFFPGTDLLGFHNKHIFLG